jgi:predicted kinase
MEKTLVLFSGLPGTGKSTLADRLARELGWPSLCIDDLTARMPQAWRTNDVPFWDTLVGMLLHLTEAQMQLGLNVIVDSVFMNTDRHHAQALAGKYEARFHLGTSHAAARTLSSLGAGHGPVFGRYELIGREL